MKSFSAYLILFTCFWIFTSSLSRAQQNGIEQPCDFLVNESGAKFIRWHAKTARTYFIQISDSTNHLAKWNYAPLIESGHDHEISHEVSADAEKGFFRLHYTDQAIPAGKTVETADFDGDGLTNSQEIEVSLPLVGTSPLKWDTDDDGLSDGWERAHQLDPNNPSDASDPFPNTTLTNLQANQAVVQAQPNATLTNQDGDSLENTDDADPTDTLVDWDPAVESSFAMIEIEGGGYPQDLNDHAEILFHDGVWSKGKRQIRQTPEITGPTHDGTFHSNFDFWTHFNNDQNLAGVSDIWYDAPQGHAVDLQSTVTWAPPQAAKELAGQIPFWDYIGPSMYPIGISHLGKIVAEFEYLTDENPDPDVQEYLDRGKIARFSPAGIFESYLPIPNGQKPIFTGFYPSTRVSRSGWVTTLLGPEGSTTPNSFKVALWTPQNTSVSLPAEAAGYFYKLNLAELPNQKICLTAATGEFLQTQVFISSDGGAAKHIPNLSGKFLQVFAGDGTAMSSSHQIWRNGQLTPMRDLCPKYGELLDQEHNIFPFKGNKSGTFLIAAEDVPGNLKTFLLVPFEFIPRTESAVSADDHSINLVVKLGNEITGLSDSFDGSTIEWQLESGNGGTLAAVETSVKDGFSATTLNTTKTKGAVYKVKARIKKLGPNGVDISHLCSWISSSEIQVVAGMPDSFAFTTTKASYRSDGTDITEVTATIKDQYGNLVEDDTAVSWTVNQTPTRPFDLVENLTTNGVSKVTVRAPLFPEDQIVTCIAGRGHDTITISVERVTGTISGNVNLDIGGGQPSTVTAAAVAADGTPVYWTTSNGEITQQSTIANGTATATLYASKGRLGKVVVTATVGDRLLLREGNFTSSSGLAIGAVRPVLIANANADGVSTPTFDHGIARQIPYYASTAVQVKGPPNSVAHLAVQASIPVVEWAFDQAPNNITPSKSGAFGITLTNAEIDDNILYAGAASLFLNGSGNGNIPDNSIFHFTDQFNATLWVRPIENSLATLASKNGAWQICTLGDGRIQASVTTQTGTYTVITPSALPLDQWTGVTADLRFNRLQIKLNNQVVTQVATTGNIIVTTSPIIVGNGFRGYLDNLAFRKGESAGLHVNIIGLDANDSLLLDANGNGVFTVNSTGNSSGGTSIRIFTKVNPEAETEIALVDPDVWDYTCDTIMSFIGGDPATNAGTVSSIAGGFLVVGDVGSCTKNLWRMAGWSDKDPNYVELSLGGLGILTTFAEITVVGAPVDAGVASVKTLSIRFGSNPKAIRFLTVFVEQIKNAIVGGGKFGWAEANFLKKMVLDIPVSDAFKVFMHDADLAKAAVNATEKLGTNAESFYQATRRAVTTHGEESAKGFVQVFEGLGNEAFEALKNAPAGELDNSFDGLAKVVNKGISPFNLKRVLDNPHLYGATYKRTNILKDLGHLANVEGIELASKMLQATHPNAKGFRYEIEGAASLGRDGEIIKSITEQVSVVWDDIEEIGFGALHGFKTDIDVITGTPGNLVYRQFKSSADSMKSPTKVAAWCEKARKARDNLGGDYQGLMFHLPPDEIPKIAKSVRKWLDDRSIPIIPINMMP
jgi:hypothetical protein